MYIFETERLGFRQWLDRDTEPYIDMCSDPVVMEYFPETHTRERSLGYIQKVGADFDRQGFGLWAVEEKQSQKFTGFIGFSNVAFESFFTPCIEIGWRLRKEFWNQGYATEGAKACLDYGFSTLGFDAVYSFTATTNKPSERVMQKIGMNYLGTFEHPNVAEGHVLRPHVLYSIERPIKP